MDDEPVWQVFSETGEPACYLLYRAIHTEPGPTSTSAEG